MLDSAAAEWARLLERGRFTPVHKSFFRTPVTWAAVFVGAALALNLLGLQGVADFTRDGLRRAEFDVGIDYGDDPARARAAGLAAIRGVDGVLADPPPQAIAHEFVATHVQLRFLLWVDLFQGGVDFAAVRTEAMEAVLRALRQAGFIVSSGVSTRVELSGRGPLDVRTAQGVSQSDRPDSGGGR